MTAYAVGIDTGGTFTDAFVSAGDEGVSTVKVETTPHDLTVCFAEAIDASARSVGLDRREFLRRGGEVGLPLSPPPPHRPAPGRAPRHAPVGPGRRGGA